jgi:hypothetical protein
MGRPPLAEVLVVVRIADAERRVYYGRPGDTVGLAWFDLDWWRREGRPFEATWTVS